MRYTGVMAEPKPKKSLGQHWLEDVDALTAICDAAEVTAHDTVLEIGPGLGTLTKQLTKRAKDVVAVEFDDALAQALPDRVSEANLSTIQQDILRFDLTTLPSGYKLVANIPYYLTSNLIRTISESINPPAVAALLIQKEVAERVAAAPGQMSLLSVSAQFYWEVSVGRVVKAELFTPPPKVDSQILILKNRSQLLFEGVDIQAYFQIVKAGFSARRKTLLNSLSAGLRLPKETVNTLLIQAGIAPAVRPQALSLEQWHALYQAAMRAGLFTPPTEN